MTRWREGGGGKEDTEEENEDDEELTLGSGLKGRSTPNPPLPGTRAHTAESVVQKKLEILLQ